MEYSESLKYGLTKGSKKQVSDDDLERISRSYCKEWKSLPPYLDLEAIEADDIDLRPIDEREKRHKFLLKWKHIKGSRATYKQLIDALLKINCVQDAEGVSSLLKQSITSKPQPLNPGSAPSISAGTGIQVRCPNSPCKWTGSTGKLQKHEASCKYELSSCPNECKDANNDIKKILKKDLENHMQKECPNRDFECRHCEKKGTYATIKQHDEKCEKKNISCTNTGCRTTIQRQNLKRHLEETCKHTEVPCKYQRIGCDKTMKRKDISSHEHDEDTHHLHMALDKIIAMDRTIVSMDEDSLNMDNKMTTFEERVVLKNGEYFTFKAEGTKGTSTVPSIYANGYHMEISVESPNRTEDGGRKEISVSLRVLEGMHDDHLNWPFVGTVTVTLLNQFNKFEHIERKMSINDGQAGKSYHLCFEPVGGFAIEYFKDDTTYFRVSVEVGAPKKPWLECTAKVENE